MIFLLSASGMSLSNELSSVLLKVSHLVARYIVPFIWDVLFITSCRVQAGSPLKESAGVWHFLVPIFILISKVLSAVGSFSNFFVLLRYNF